MPCARAPGLLSIFVSMALALAAVSSTGKDRTGSVQESNPPEVSFKPPRLWDSPSTDPLVMKASAALRDAGYHIMGSAFEIFAVEVLPAGPATFFAINDPALVNTTLPSWLMLNLLRYHTTNEMLLGKDLQILESGACLPTRLHGKGLIVTGVQTVNSTVALNGVEISHPDIFSAGGLTIHGVHRPFYYFDPSLDQLRFDSLPFVSCNVSDFLSLPNARSAPTQRHNNGTNWELWRRLQLALRDNGCLSFYIAMSLQIKLLNAWLAEATGNSTARITVFAPVDAYANLSSSPSYFGNNLTFHVVPQRLTSADLCRLPARHKIPTLFRGHSLEITCTRHSNLAINYVPVIQPDAFVTDDFVLHGILWALDPSNVTTTT